MNTENKKYLDYALSLLEISREIAKSMSSNFKIEEKKDKSLVTEVDKAIEVALREKISKDFPNHGIIGEEFPDYNPKAEYKWILDPIDGTEDFAFGMPFWGTIIALHKYENQTESNALVGVVDHPDLRTTIYGAKGLGAFKDKKKLNLGKEKGCISLTTRANFRRFENPDDEIIFNKINENFPNFRTFRTVYGHSAAIFDAVDAMVEYNIRFWDVAASKLLIEEAGGKYVNIKRENLEGHGVIYSAIMGKKETIDKMIEVLKLENIDTKE